MSAECGGDSPRDSTTGICTTGAQDRNSGQVAGLREHDAPDWICLAASPSQCGSSSWFHSNVCMRDNGSMGSEPLQYSAFEFLGGSIDRATMIGDRHFPENYSRNERLDPA